MPTEANSSNQTENRGESLPTAERLRRAQAEHDIRLNKSAQERVLGILQRRSSQEGNANAAKMMEDFTIMQGAPIKERDAVDAPGVGVTEKCVIGEGDAERIGFLKWQRGEMTVKATQEGVVKVIRKLQDDGTMTTEDSPMHGNRARMFQTFLAHRTRTRVAEQKSMGDAYGISPDRMPWQAEPIGLKRVDIGHGARAEVAASSLGALVGFPEIPVTALREDRHELGSVQMRVTGEELNGEHMVQIYAQGEKHPAAPSLARMAAMDWLLKSSDRHPNNIFFDSEKNQFFGIDNGYSNGYSVPNTEKPPDAPTALERVPVDRYRSVAIEMMESLPNIKLSDVDRSSLRSLVDEVQNYMKVKEGKLSEAELATLPAAVKEGQMAKAISDTFRMLHERVDADGKTTAESAAIAKREAHDFLARADYLAIHGRLPDLSKNHIDRFGTKELVAARIAAQSPVMNKAA